MYIFANSDQLMIFFRENKTKSELRYRKLICEIAANFWMHFSHRYILKLDEFENINGIINRICSKQYANKHTHAVLGMYRLKYFPESNKSGV